MFDSFADNFFALIYDKLILEGFSVIGMKLVVRQQAMTLVFTPFRFDSFNVVLSLLFEFCGKKS